MICRILISCLLFLSIGCTHTRLLSSYDQINRHVIDKSVRISLADGTLIKANNILIRPDSSCVTTETSSKQIVPTSKIQYITVLNRGRGAWEGFGLFLIAGTALGLVGYFSGDDPSGFMSFTAEEKLKLSFLAGLGWGALIGAPIGALIGSKDKYVLPPKSGSSPNFQSRHRNDFR